MKNKNMTIVCTLLIFIGQNIYAQIETDTLRALKLYDPNPKNKTFSFGIGSFKVKDTQLSPLAHSGISINADYQTIRYRKWGFTESNANIGIGSGDDKMSQLISWINYTYSLNKLIYACNNVLFLYIGGAASGNIYINIKDGYGYNVASSATFIQFDPVATLKYRFRLGRQRLDFTYQVSTPVLGAGVFPCYNDILEAPISEDSEDTFKFNARITAFHNNTGLTNKAYIDWRRMKRGKEAPFMLRLGYSFNGERFNTGSKIQYGNTQVFLGIIHKY